QPGGTLRISDSIDATALDPQVSNQINVFSAYVEGLTSVDAAGEVQPFLATSWEASPDARTYTFTLRDGVHFHNGRAMTADDVVWALERIKDPNTVAQRGNDLRDLSFAATDPRTVRVTSAQPNAAVPALMASCSILAPESVGDDGAMTQPIGTGPFVF